MYLDIEDEAIPKSGVLELPHITFASESFLDEICGLSGSLPKKYIELLQREYQDPDTSIKTALMLACYNRDDEIGALLVSMGVDVNRPYQLSSDICKYPIEDSYMHGMPKTLDALIKSESINLRDCFDLVSYTYEYKLFDSFKILLSKGHYTDEFLQKILENLCFAYGSYGPKFTSIERQEWLKELAPLKQLDWACSKHLIYKKSEYHDIILSIIQHHNVDMTGYLLTTAHLGWFDITEILLASGVSPYKQQSWDTDGVNPYYIGIEERHSDFISLLIKYGVDVNKYQKYPSNLSYSVSYPPTPLLLLAIKQENLTAFSELVKVPGIQEKDEALKEAVSFNKIGFTRLLVENGANFNAISPYGSILQLALDYNSQECVDYLLSLDHIDVEGSPEHSHPLFKCVANCDLKNIRILLNRIIDINIRDFDGGLIFKAIRTKNEEVIKLICSHPNIDLNCFDRNNYTPIFYIAVENLGAKIAKILLDTGKINLKYDAIPVYHASYTSLHSAVRNNDMELVKLLLDYEPGIVNSISKFDYSPLFVAIVNFKGKEICDLLIKAGADINYECNEWYSCNISQISTRDIESFKYMLYEGYFDNRSDEYFRRTILMRYDTPYDHNKKISEIYEEHQAFIKFGTLTESVLENVRRVGGWREDLFSSDSRKVLEARVRLLSSEFDRNLLHLPEVENVDKDVLEELEHFIDDSYEGVSEDFRKKLITLGYYHVKYLEGHPEHVTYEVARSVGAFMQAVPRFCEGKFI